MYIPEKGDSKGWVFSPGISHNSGLLLCIACILLGVHMYILLCKNVFCENTESEKSFYHSHVDVTSNFGRYKHLISSVTSLAMLPRLCLSIVVPCFQSLKNILQDYCMLSQLNFCSSLFTWLPSWKWQYFVTLPSFEIDFLFLIQFIRSWKYGDCFKISVKTRQ